MPEIDSWSELLSEEMRSVWPMLAGATRNLSGSLVGGTALAIHLRHRVSFDLDFMTLEEFSGDRVARSLASMTEDIDVAAAATDEMHATIRGVDVQVFRAPRRGTNPGYVCDLREPVQIDGMPVASLADLLASKLDVIMYRPKLRDYIDLVAIDASGTYRLEDGLLFHTRRYGTMPPSRDLSRIVALLEEPGALEADRTFDAERVETLDYLRRRVPALQRHLLHLRAPAALPPRERSTGRMPLGPVDHPRGDPLPRPSGDPLDP